MTAISERFSKPYQTTTRIVEAQNLSYGKWDWWHRLVEEREHFNPEGNIACTGKDHNLFYPPTGKAPTQALEICRGCEVRVECLQHALDNNERDGLWGGVTESRRRRYRLKGWTAEKMIEQQDKGVK